MAAYLGDTDSEDELPSHWQERIHSDGRVYYANHLTQSTQWTHPKTGEKKSVPASLPYGWYKTEDESGQTVFIEESTGKRTYVDPRLAFSRETKQSLYDFRQRFDASSTAEQVLNGVDLRSKTALVTGASAGIGLETAKALAKHGCEVIMACRNAEKTNECIAQIKSEKATAKLEFIPLNLESLQSVKDFANEVKLKYSCVDIFIWNAGIFGASFALTEDNFEKTFQVNYLSQFYLLLLLKPLLTNSGTSRIVIVSSESHRFSLLTKNSLTHDYLSPLTSKYFTSFMAYNDSKLLTSTIACEINSRWGRHGTTCNSVHPGNMVFTDLSKSWWFYRILFFLVRPFTKSVSQAASTTLWAATADELNGVGGQYFNNCWFCVPCGKVYDEEFARSLWNVSLSMLSEFLPSKR